MTDDSMALADLLQKAGDGDFLRSVAETVLQMLMEVDVESQIGAGRHERSAERLTQRNGYRDRSLDTGTIRNFVLGGVILKQKETLHGPTQRCRYPGCDPRPVAGWR
jgi:hypothetical protein